MMRFLKSISLALTIVLMFVMGSIELSMASHAIDHQHHSAQTHTTGYLCLDVRSRTHNSH